MRQPLTNQFSSSPGANFLNMQDLVAVGSGAGANCALSAGSTLIDAVNFTLGPGLGQTFTITSVSIEAYVELLVNANLSFPPAGPFGQLGAILGALVVQDASQTPGNFGTAAVLPLPPDMSLSVPLFDPAVNPLPPIRAGASFAPFGPGTMLALSGSILPPNPIELPPNTTPSVGVGIWMLPSLLGILGLGQIGMRIWGASYCVTYDDGL